MRATRAADQLASPFDTPYDGVVTKGESWNVIRLAIKMSSPPAGMSPSELSERDNSAQLTPTPWVAAAVVAEHLGVEVSYVYEHAGELGARRLGNGPKARLRFRLDLVDRSLTLKSSGADDIERPLRTSPRRRRHRSSSSRTVPLLPIRASRSDGH